MDESSGLDFSGSSGVSGNDSTTTPHPANNSLKLDLGTVKMQYKIKMFHETFSISDQLYAKFPSLLGLDDSSGSGHLDFSGSGTTTHPKLDLGKENKECLRNF